MLLFLKNHPFAVEAFFSSSVVLTFAIPKDQLQKLIPPCLELDTFNDKWAFVAIAMVETKGLRPKGFPKFLGNDFFLIGYRIFVKYLSNAGKHLRGLYILKSETNKKRMELMGNLFTHYSYTTTDITTEEHGNIKEIKSIRSNFNLTIDTNSNQTSVSLPDKSPFINFKEARRFAGPLPFTFHYNPERREVLIIEGVRQNWIPKPLTIVNYSFEFFNSLHFREYSLANAFMINDIPYFWKKGKIEKWIR